MQRLKCTICYDGTLFSGFQVQPGKRTVQSEVEAALKRLHKGSNIKITSSGRTDAGVHALGQVFHFDSPLLIPEDSWGKALEALLPEDIVVRKTEKAEADFHARFDAVGKEYRYFIRLAREKDPFGRLYQYHFTYPLHIERMREAASYLIGTHDFTSFCSAKSEVVDRVRTINEIEIIEEGELLSFHYSGTGFLYNMVRILTGTLLEVGRGRRNPEEIPQILDQKDRQLAGKTAPAHGLYLWEVFY